MIRFEDNFCYLLYIVVFSACSCYSGNNEDVYFSSHCVYRSLYWGIACRCLILYDLPKFKVVCRRTTAYFFFFISVLSGYFFCFSACLCSFVSVYDSVPYQTSGRCCSSSAGIPFDRMSFLVFFNTAVVITIFRF